MRLRARVSTGFPQPRMKGETAELSKLMQNKREEKTTPGKEVFTKKERGKSQLSRKENAKARPVCSIRVQTTPIVIIKALAHFRSLQTDHLLKVYDQPCYPQT